MPRSTGGGMGFRHLKITWEMLITHLFLTEIVSLCVCQKQLKFKSDNWNSLLKLLDDRSK